MYTLLCMQSGHAIMQNWKMLCIELHSCVRIRGRWKEVCMPCKELENFDHYFQVWKNVIIEQAQFDSQYQQEGKTSEQHITQCTVASYLASQLAFCMWKIAGFKEEMIRYCVMVGIRDKSSS